MVEFIVRCNVLALSVLLVCCLFGVFGVCFCFCLVFLLICCWGFFGGFVDFFLGGLLL